ncbi:MAG TPA: helix-turn-helix domain-containing protein [Solirubrobacteraceae bacterium]
MSTTLPKPRELQRMTALAHLDAEELRLEVENEQASISAAGDPSSASQAEYGKLLERWALLARRILDSLDVPIGVTVEQAAERLDVTAPTVRKWLKEGLLRRTEGRKPVEVDPRSLIELHRALATVRESYPSRQWSKALAAYLHDRDLQSQAWFGRGRGEFERGEFIER